MIHFRLVAVSYSASSPQCILSPPEKVGNNAVVDSFVTIMEATVVNDAVSEA